MEGLKGLAAYIDKAVFGDNPFAPEKFAPGSYHHLDQDSPRKLMDRYLGDLRMMEGVAAEEWRDALASPTLVAKVRAVLDLFISPLPH